MSETRDPPDALTLLEAVAAALREEPSVPIEEQPGLRHPGEAGQVNRAFRIMVRTLLRTGQREDDDHASRSSDALLRLARRGLELGLLDPPEAEHLLRLESQGRDDGLAYLILTPWPEIEHLLETRGPDQG